MRYIEGMSERTQKSGAQDPGTDIVHRSHLLMAERFFILIF